MLEAKTVKPIQLQYHEIAGQASWFYWEDYHSLWSSPPRSLDFKGFAPQVICCKFIDCPFGNVA